MGKQSRLRKARKLLREIERETGQPKAVALAVCEAFIKDRDTSKAAIRAMNAAT